MCSINNDRLNPGHQLLPECSSHPMNPNNICQTVARLIRRLLSATVSNDLQNAVLTDFAIMYKAKYLCFCEKFTTAQKTHSSFERNKVFLQMKNRKMLKTCFEMKHKYRETWWKEQQKFNYKFSNFPMLFNAFVPKTILVVTFIK